MSNQNLRRRNTVDLENGGEVDEDTTNALALLSKAAETDFLDEKSASFRQFQQEFKKRGNSRLLLLKLAALDSTSFYERNGPGLLKWAMKYHPGHFLEGHGHGDQKDYPLHVAIKKGNHVFMECFIEYFTDFQKTAVKKFEEALEQTNQWGENCLHLAIDGRQSFAASLIKRCSDKVLEKADATGRTPLHRVMTMRYSVSNDFVAKVTPSTEASRNSSNIAKSRVSQKAPIYAWDEPNYNHEDPNVKAISWVKFPTGTPKPPDTRSANKGKVFDPAEIIKEIEGHCKGKETSKLSKDGPRRSLLAKLLTMTNAGGFTPYQKCEETLNRDSDKSFRGLCKDLIYNNLVEIPDVRKALYGTKGPINPSMREEYTKDVCRIR